MNKYYRNIIIIMLIVIIFFMLFAYWLNLNFGYGQLFLIIAGGYGIYLNLNAQIKERKQT